MGDDERQVVYGRWTSNWTATKSFSTSGGGGLEPCSSCGRTFNPETLAKHERICQRNQIKKRRVFDSGKQRAEGTGIGNVSKLQRPGLPNQAPTNNWRQKHQDFINGLRSARAAQKAIATGGPLPPPPPPSINPDYIECPHCHRRFNQTAGSRHIPFCADRSKTHGAPVKPLHKRAAADVRQSATGTRKAYDNRVVRRKGNSNPYEFANSSTVSMTPNGSRAVTPKYDIIKQRRPPGGPSRNNSYPRQSLPMRNQQVNNTPSISSQRNNSQQHQPSSYEQNNERLRSSQYGQPDDQTRTLNGHHNSPSSVGRSRTQNGQHSDPSSEGDFIVRQNGTIVRMPRGRGSAPVRSAVAGSRPRSRRPKSAVRFADQLERVAGQDLPTPHPPPSPAERPPPSPQYDSALTRQPGAAPNPTRLHREQMYSPGLRSSPRLSQESLSPGREDENPPPPRHQTTVQLRMGQRSSSGSVQRSSPSLNNNNSPMGTPPGSPSTRFTSIQSSQQVPMRMQNGGGAYTSSNLSRHHTTGSSNELVKSWDKKPIQASLAKSPGTNLPAPYCYDCGTQYPVMEARFCCGCGVQRAFISEPPSL